MITEAIILAGGKGTRLQSVVSDVPKPMAPIKEKPFLFYLISFLKSQGIKRIVISVGYKATAITEFFGGNFQGISIIYAMEESPLGTGGAIRLAMDYVKTTDVIVVNGDTFFDVPLQKLIYYHTIRNSDYTIALHEVESKGRYGGVEIDNNGKVIGFTAKDKLGSLTINAGIYIINKKAFQNEITYVYPFSIEDDFLKKLPASLSFYAVEYKKHFFIDIGIPEDYQKAQCQIPEVSSRTFHFLFLDRDGVINRKIDNGYVLSLLHWEFIPGVLSAFSKLRDYFSRIFVITNQRGVGRGLMTSKQLEDIHEHLRKEVFISGGNIDKIYYCTDTEDSSPNRKPNIGMALQAKKDFSEIDFGKSIMIGDSKGDLILGRSIGMKTILLLNGNVVSQDIINYADEVYETLPEWFKHFELSTEHYL